MKTEGRFLFARICQKETVYSECHRIPSVADRNIKEHMKTPARDGKENFKHYFKTGTVPV